MTHAQKTFTDIDPPVPSNLDAERAVLGAILLDNKALAIVRPILSKDNFLLLPNGHVYQHIIELIDRGTPADLITVIEKATSEGNLEVSGGPAYIASLPDGLPRISNVEHHAVIVRNKSTLRAALHFAEAIKTAVYQSEEGIEEIQKRFLAAGESLRPLNGNIPSFTAKQFCCLKLPVREFLLEPLITTRSMGELYAWRGVGKTFAALAIAHAVATGQSFLRLQAPRAAGVLYVDGELDGDSLQKRLRQLGADKDEFLEPLCVDTLPDPFPHLATARAQRIIEDKLADKNLLVLDNLSALGPSTNETEAEDWMSIQAWLLSLRKNGIASLFLNHAGHAGWSRRTTRREDLLDWVAKLEWPKDYNPAEGLRFEMRFTKTRAFMATAANPIEAKLIPDPETPDSFIWTYSNLEDVRVGQIVELRANNNSWREISEITGIPKSTAERLWRIETTKGKKS